MRDTLNPSNKLKITVYLKDNVSLDFSKSILDMSNEEDYNLLLILSKIAKPLLQI